jgi:hypothetical protein
MDQKIAAIAVAISALAAAGAHANPARLADPAGLYHQVAAVPLRPQNEDRREVIAPPSDVDRGMAIKPPLTGARMPIVASPEASNGRFGIQR